MEKYLVLFSGGMDSFLTAAMYAEQNIPVVLISMNNGAVAAEEHLLHGVKRLQNKYGTELIEYAGVCPIYGTVQRLKYEYFHMSHAELARKYPTLCANQLQCLICQSAMWVAAIAYAVAKDIKHVAAGYHSYDEFCTGCQDWTTPISLIASQYDVLAHFPVWAEDAWQDKAVRAMAMMDRGFEPQVLEPKCLLGLPDEKPDEDKADELVRYFHNHVRDMMPELIDRLIPHFRMTKLSEKSLQALDYEIPEPTGGIY